MKWTEIVTAIAALLGAILATITLVHRFRQSRPNIQVDIKETILVPFIGNPSNHGEPFGPVINVTTCNTGQKKVTLNSWGFKVNRNKNVIVTRPSGLIAFPYELEPNSSCVLWFPSKELAERLHSGGFSGIVNLAGYIEDAVNQKYNSKPMKFNIDLVRIAPQLKNKTFKIT